MKHEGITNNEFAHHRIDKSACEVRLGKFSSWDFRQFNPDKHQLVTQRDKMVQVSCVKELPEGISSRKNFQFISLSWG
jgi:hypothetical protein